MDLTFLLLAWMSQASRCTRLTSPVLTFEASSIRYSTTDDIKNGPSLKEATRLLLTAKDDDSRKIFVRGFPTKAGEAVVNRFFSRCGDVSGVQLLNLANASQNSGRVIVTFDDEESVEVALDMHRFKMGKKGKLEVYRVNRGDKEEVHNVKKELHGALIGLRGSNVQKMQSESGARIFFEAYGTREVMIIKGTAQQRDRAWMMAQGIMEENKCDVHKVSQDMHGRLIGKKGSVKVAMEEESGAHIVYRKVEQECHIYGTDEARSRAWQLVKDKMWAMQHTSEQVMPMDKKYHGMLTGKQGATVKAMQECTGAQIRFIADKDEKGEGNGAMVVRGTPEQCKRCYAIAEVIIRELPSLLTDLREEDIALGSLRSLPLSASQVWKVAVKTAIETAEKELGEIKDERSDAEAKESNVVVL
jgi:transcription antitermination factor NusA-like protein